MDENLVRNVIAYLYGAQPHPRLPSTGAVGSIMVLHFIILRPGNYLEQSDVLKKKKHQYEDKNEENHGGILHMENKKSITHDFYQNHGEILHMENNKYLIVGTELTVTKKEDKHKYDRRRKLIYFHLWQKC